MARWPSEASADWAPEAKPLSATRDCSERSRSICGGCPTRKGCPIGAPAASPTAADPTAPDPNTTLSPLPSTSSATVRNSQRCAAIRSVVTASNAGNSTLFSPSGLPFALPLPLPLPMRRPWRAQEGGGGDAAQTAQTAKWHPTLQTHEVALRIQPPPPTEQPAPSRRLSVRACWCKAPPFACPGQLRTTPAAQQPAQSWQASQRKPPAMSPPNSLRHTEHSPGGATRRSWPEARPLSTVYAAAAAMRSTSCSLGCATTGASSTGSCSSSASSAPASGWSRIQLAANSMLDVTLRAARACALVKPNACSDSIAAGSMR
mmetsp:Transcript_45275/g.125619  ORF Transcript_45275/g.125619 Transcript_45275/m.125619 type:complete len:318 (-) Transcript_45275:246-1199(-)